MYAAGTGRVEEAVLSFGRVGCEGRLRPPVFLFQVVPLLLLARAFEITSDGTHLYASVLRAEV